MLKIIHKRSKQLLTIILLLFSFNLSFAQQNSIDALSEKILNYKINDTIKVNLLNALAFNYHLVQPDSTIKIANRANNIATSLKYTKGSANALKLFAIGAYVKGEYTQAIALNYKALSLFKSIYDKEGEAAVLNNMANIYQNIGEYTKALTYYNYSLTIRTEINNLVGIASCFNNIGNVYFNLGNYADALQYLLKGLEIRENLNDTIGIANSYSNIAGIFVVLKKYNEAIDYSNKSYTLSKLTGDLDGQFQNAISIGAIYTNKELYTKALDYFKNALALSEFMGSINNQAVSITNIAEVYYKQGLCKQAINAYTQALALSYAAIDPQGIASCNIGLGQCNLSLKKTNKAIFYLTNGYNEALKINNKYYILEGATYLAKAYKLNGDIKKENYFLNQVIVYKDSLFNEETKLKINELEFNYKLDKKQDEIALLETNNILQAEKAQKQYLILVTLVLLISILVLFVYLQKRAAIKERKSKELIIESSIEIKKQKERLEDLNTIKDKMLSVLSHDLRSPISSLTSVVSLIDAEVFTIEDYLQIKNKFRDQLQSLNILIDNTLHWAKSQINGNLKPSKELFLLDNIVLQNFDLFKYNAEQKEITLIKSYDEKMQVFADKSQLDIILRNLIGNAIKFTDKGGKVEVLAQANNNQVTISIRDNGIGIPKDKLDDLFSYAKPHNEYGTGGEQGAGIGLILAHEYVVKNDGKLTVESEENKGTTFHLTLPLS